MEQVTNKKPIIFVIAGLGRHGKDTTAAMIRAYYEARGQKTINLDFAHYIKEYTMRILNWDGKEATKPRAFLQYLGTDLIRNQIDNEIFIRRTQEDIAVFSYFYDIITISDARFDAEIKGIKEKFDRVITIKVVRSNFTTDLNVAEQNHITEHGITDATCFDYIIQNDASLGELEAKVNLIMEEIEDEY